MEGFDHFDEIHYGMLNSYDIVVYKVPFSELSFSDYSFFIHDITKPITTKVVDDLIMYFEELEEYEKCQVLTEIRHEYDTI